MSGFIESLVGATANLDLRAINERNARLYAEYERGPTGDIDGAPFIADLNYLSLIIQHFGVKTVVEIGTSTGTSARAMAAMSGDIHIHTCDVKPLYKGNHERIHFKKMVSKNYLSWLIGNGVIADLVFCDATLREADYALILNIFRRGWELIAIHDMWKPSALRRVIAFMGRNRGFSFVDAKTLGRNMKPRTTLVDGIEINNLVGLLVGKRWRL